MSKNSMIVLIIDDSKLSRNLLKHYILSEYDDLEIIEEVDGNRGLESYFEKKPDLTFLDLTMPDMDGFEFLEKMGDKGKGGPVAVLSADIQEISRARAKDLGADYFITKPIKTKLPKINEIVDNIRAGLGLTGIELTADQLDSVIEIFNIGVGKGGDSLSQLTGEQITLSVPKVELVEHSAIKKYLYEAMALENNFFSVQQPFKGEFHGYAFLLFREPDVKKLINVVLGEEESKSASEDDGKDTILEIVNIILSATVGVFGNTLETPINFLPTSIADRDFKILDEQIDPTFMRYALVANVSFLIKEKKIEGFLVLIISVRSIKLLLSCLDKMMHGK